MKHELEEREDGSVACVTCGIVAPLPATPAPEASAPFKDCCGCASGIECPGCPGLSLHAPEESAPGEKCQLCKTHPADRGHHYACSYCLARFGGRCGACGNRRPAPNTCPTCVADAALGRAVRETGRAWMEARTKLDAAGEAQRLHGCDDAPHDCELEHHEAENEAWNAELSAREAHLTALRAALGEGTR